MTLLLSWAVPQWSLWQHLSEHVLWDYISTTLLLGFGVGIGSLTLGGAAAWCIARYRFVGHGVLSWLLLLPLAMPAYIIAYTYTGMLDVAGPVQAALRNLTGWQLGGYWFPDIRSLSGAVIMLSLVLYPYVYLLARNAFADQAASLAEVSRSLGLSQWQTFWRVTVPLARPALLAGTALAMMEAFADYGTVQYFGLNTFTTGIFRTWFGMGNTWGAAQLSSLLGVFVLLLLLWERHSRRHLTVYQSRATGRKVAPLVLSGWRGVGVACLCALLPAVGFLIPAVQLASWVWQSHQQWQWQDFTTLALNSVMLALASAMLIVTLALALAYGRRLFATKVYRAQLQLTVLGYALPGTVLAVGALLPLGMADRGINHIWRYVTGDTVGLVLSGTLFALILVYTVRFITVAFHNVDTGLNRITPDMDRAARSLGHGPLSVLRRIHLPLLRNSVLAALLLVFVDVLKELPATLILRPFNFNTLAVKAYELASDERLTQAALPALTIVLVGLVPVVLLTRAMKPSKENR
ncbi:iron ABC transporter permease [Aestuariibacter halophilus]|uniref:Iron ABC transporter permease n=1 Tax=Fluctibacter halophilus TaxID=226011 RepID=A0ABS8G682_9ALTE|nr:iron ABC transporter permease [Aestuariibacter halophilus]